MGLEARRSGGGLGRGLESLIPTRSPGISLTRDLPVASIQPHPDQPRRTFDPEDLQQLADSIAEFGLLQPIIVTEIGDALHPDRWRTPPARCGHGGARDRSCNRSHC